MEEDGNLGYSGGNYAKNNFIRVWKEQHKCDDPAGRHLGRSGPTNPL